MGMDKEKEQREAANNAQGDYMGITETVVDIWETGEVEEKIFNSLYGLAEESFWNPSFGGNVGFRDIFMSKAIGCYFPPKGRAFYTDTIDVKNDGLPIFSHLSGIDDFFYYGQKEDIPTVSSCTIYPIKCLPKMVRGPHGCRYYKLVFWKFYENGSPQTFAFEINPFDKDNKVDTVIWNDYVAVNPKNDAVIPCFHKNPIRQLNREFVKFLFCTTVSSESDRRFLWNVSLYYRFSKEFNMWIDFGVHEEHVKSLFFARDTPLSNTGRKRPIQHWVSSHQRRVRDGIKINIAQYLRGITEFKMYGYDFLIISPRKRTDDDQHDLLQEKRKIIEIGTQAPQYLDGESGDWNRVSKKESRQIFRKFMSKNNKQLYDFKDIKQVDR